MKFDLKKKLKGFLKRSWSYKLAVTFGIMGFVMFAFGTFCVWQLDELYNSNPESFLPDEPEELRAIGFVSIALVIAFMTLLLSGLCYLFMTIFYFGDQEDRLKALEAFAKEQNWGEEFYGVEEDE